MFGRNNIFDRSNNNTSNNSISGSNYNSGNGGGYSRQMPACGSNRLEYFQEKIPATLTDYISQWKECPPFSISCRLETLHLHPVEIRIEDYYLMRTGKLRASQTEKVKAAIKSQSFNEELLKNQPHKLPLSSSQKAIDLQTLKSATRGGPNTGYSSGYANSSGATNNIFASNSTSSTNIFNRNSQGASSSGTTNNIFMNTSNTNKSSANIFGNMGGGGGQQNANIYSGSTNTGGNNSLQNNVFSSNRGASNTGNNIYGGSSSGGNNGNIFGNIQGSQGGNNIFSKNNQGSSNQGNNIFNNGSNSNSNNFFNNGNNINSNNIFNKQGNNSQQGSSSNNMFNNPSSNISSNQNPNLNQFISTLHNYLHTTQQYMQQLYRKKQKSNTSDQDYQNYSDNYQQITATKQNKKIFEINDVNLAELPHWETLSPKKDVLYVAPSLGKWKINKSNHQQEEDLNHSFLGRPVHSRIIRDEHNNQDHSLRINSRMSNYPQSIRNQTIKQTNQYGSSMIYSRCGPKKQQELRIDSHSQVKFKFEIIWLQSIKNNDCRNTYESKEVQGMIELQMLDLENQEGIQDFLRKAAADQNLGIRIDAVLKIDRKKCMVQLNYRSQATVVGKVYQKIVNLQGNYEVFYSRVRSGYLSDFTISNSQGTISWNDPIPYQFLDFRRGYDFSIENNNIDCKLPSLQSSCRVKFCKAPKSILKLMSEKGLKQARRQLQKRVTSKGQGIEFGELWENGQWCLIFKNGFLS